MQYKKRTSIHIGDTIILDFKEKDIAVTPLLHHLEGMITTISKIRHTKLGLIFEAKGLVTKYGVPYSLSDDMFKVVKRVEE